MSRTWCYRIVDRGQDADGHDLGHAICEVHADRGHVVGIADQAATFVAFVDGDPDPRAALVWSLERALEAARSAPIITALGDAVDAAA